MKKQAIYFCDFETLTKHSKDYQKLKHTDVFLIYIKNIQGDWDYIWYSLDEFMDWVITNEEDKIIYFHNLSFDGNFIFKWLLRNYPRQFNNWLGYNGKDYYKLFKNNNKYYYIEVCMNNYKTKFKCTLNLLSSSIKNLGKCFKLQKLEEIDKLISKEIIKDKEDFYNQGGFNMNKDIKEAFINYIKQDVEIARLAYISLEENINHLNELYSNKKNAIKLRNELTIGTIVYKLSKNYLQKNYHYVYKRYKLNYKQYNLAHNWYYGGWTQFNPFYWNKKLDNLNGCVIDINSSYPYQMTKALPFGRLEEKRNGRWLYHLEYYEVDVYGAKIRDEYKDFIILKNWKKEDNRRYVKELENFKCFYTKDEWEFLNKIYYFNVKSLKKWYCEAGAYLNNFIQELYKYKEDYKSKGELANAHTYKIMLNSLYGKQCARASYPLEFYIPQNELELWKQYRNERIVVEVEENRYIVQSVSSKLIPSINAYIVRLELVEVDGDFTHVLIGAQITSYARLQLWNAIKDVGVNNYMYCDTDSIFFNKNFNEVKKHLQIHPTELGKWDLESTFNKGKILGAKRYCMLNEEDGKIKLGFAGANRLQIDEVNWDRLIMDNIEIENAQVFREEDDYGILIGLKNLKIKKGGN